MAQLPDENKHNESIMDNINNYETQNDESKMNQHDFDDNDSNQAAMDINDVLDQQMAINDAIQHNTIIQNRENGPPPPQQGTLTLDSLNQLNEMNPPQSKSSYTHHGLMTAQRSDGANSNHSPHLGFGGGVADIMDSFGGSQTIPEILVQNLIEMGFTREKSIYALQQVEKTSGQYSVDLAVSWLFDHPTFEVPTYEPQDTSNIVGTIQNMLGNTNSNIQGTSPPNNSPDHGNNRGGLSGNDGPFQQPVITNGYNNNNNNNNNENIIYDLLEQTAKNMSNMVGGQSKSKSNTIYSHSDTLGSAATVHDDEKKDGNNNKNTNNIDNNNNNTLQKPIIETKTDEDDLQPLPTRIHHQATTSTVASEMTEISQLSTGIRSQSPSMVTNTNTNTNCTKTKDQIAQLYQEQQILEATNRNTISNFMIPSDIKMVIVVRKDLGMKPGKVAAQCCHGCLGVVMDIINGAHISSSFNNNNNSKQIYNLKELLDQWRMNGEKKIVLQCQNEEKLLELKQKAEIYNLPNYLVTDAGHTQIAKGSKTVVAIGPYPSIDIDQVTGGLKLY